MPNSYLPVNNQQTSEIGDTFYHCYTSSSGHYTFLEAHPWFVVKVSETQITVCKEKETYSKDNHWKYIVVRWKDGTAICRKGYKFSRKPSSGFRSGAYHHGYFLAEKERQDMAAGLQEAIDRKQREALINDRVYALGAACQDFQWNKTWSGLTAEELGYFLGEINRLRQEITTRKKLNKAVPPESHTASKCYLGRGVTL